MTIIHSKSIEFSPSKPINDRLEIISGKVQLNEFLSKKALVD
jgi:hypothetical protein